MDTEGRDSGGMYVCKLNELSTQRARQLCHGTALTGFNGDGYIPFLRPLGISRLKSYSFRISGI